ncbi:phosphohistidine phosphatase [Caulobacter ginsengisoli]|uniref:Phosphohistidine phosphatase n=1 Tax=Caulobacter ginsengisoli TaxID=400775 RepID=A0ABU0IXD1_9CAUL|nr:histidine phosphatase family protein [Caulobacter ginsengisoli]MDQ0466657.1 phosphohistidine phosphatase [Caulobacter ginsengisoli]
MQRLILMRHGKAERSAPGGDAARALTERGRSDAALMAALLVKEDLIPDLALVSPALRTRQTWEAAAPAFPKARAEVLDALYHAPAATIFAVAEASGADTVMAVGHNPGLHSLMVALLREGGCGQALIGRAESGFPTASVAAFTFDAAGRPSYDGLFLAKDHGGGGGE